MFQMQTGIHKMYQRNEPIQYRHHESGCIAVKTEFSWKDIIQEDLGLRTWATPTKHDYGFVMIDGKPINVLHGTKAIAYIDGKRTELPVQFVSADSYEAALDTFLQSHAKSS